MRDFTGGRQISEYGALKTLALVGFLSSALFSLGCAGLVSSKNPGSNPPGSTTPSVSITAPANGATVEGMVTITASATDSAGIAAVQFLLDGANLGSRVTTSRYSVS